MLEKMHVARHFDSVELTQTFGEMFVYNIRVIA